MSKAVKMKCPIGFDEITIKFLDPNELVITRRKGPDGKYRRVLKPRKEVKAPKCEVLCPSLEIPALADVPPALRRRLMEEEKAWCRKRQDICPHEEMMPILLERLNKESEANP